MKIIERLIEAALSQRVHAIDKASIIAAESRIETRYISLKIQL